MPRYDLTRMGSSPRPWQGADPDAATETQEPGGLTQKVDPTVAGYLPPEQGPFMCSNCTYFSNPNACQVVDGAIAPDGCCNLYTPSKG